MRKNLSATGFNSFIPGFLTVFEDSEMPPSYGFSLKRIGEKNDGNIYYNSFEFRGAYNFDSGKYMLDFTWPSYLGIIAPGISFDYDENGFTPWVYGEVDLFYFPFAFAAIVAFEKPVFIPSAYLVYKVGPEGDKFDAGIRISFPVYNKDKIDG